MSEFSGLERKHKGYDWRLDVRGGEGGGDAPFNAEKHGYLVDNESGVEFLKESATPASSFYFVTTRIANPRKMRSPTTMLTPHFMYSGFILGVLTYTMRITLLRLECWLLLKFERRDCS